jgi:hypothetical protein
MIEVERLTGNQICKIDGRSHPTSTMTTTPSNRAIGQPADHCIVVAAAS